MIDQDSADILDQSISSTYCSITKLFYGEKRALEDALNCVCGVMQDLFLKNMLTEPTFDNQGENS